MSSNLLLDDDLQALGAGSCRIADAFRTRR